MNKVSSIYINTYNGDTYSIDLYSRSITAYNTDEPIDISFELIDKLFDIVHFLNDKNEVKKND